MIKEQVLFNNLGTGGVEAVKPARTPPIFPYLLKRHKEQTWRISNGEVGTFS
jgi:hypothetical protein